MVLNWVCRLAFSVVVVAESAAWARDFAAAIKSVIASIPLFAAFTSPTASPIESLRAARSPARCVCPCAAKKATGSSNALFTFEPVARRTWVFSIRSVVFCNWNRFDLIPAVSVTDMIFLLFWIFALAFLPRGFLFCRTLSASLAGYFLAPPFSIFLFVNVLYCL